MMTTRFEVVMFAAQAHAGQTRKYTGEPYIIHALDVANRLAKVGAREEVIWAGLLHDVVEDTRVTNNDIRVRFGDRVAQLVEMVTDVSVASDGNRAVRKEIDRKHLALADKEGASIKLADLISNSLSIQAYDPGFAKVYIPEKRRLLRVLRHSYHPALWFEASEIYETFDRWANSGAACFPLPQTVWEFGAIIAEMDHRKAVEQYMWNDNECNPLRKVK